MTCTCTSYLPHIADVLRTYTSEYVRPRVYVRPRNVHTRHSPAIVVPVDMLIVTVNSVAKRYLYERKYD